MNKPPINENKELINNIRFYIRLALIPFTLFIGVWFGIRNAFDINKVYIIIAFCSGCILTLGYILSVIDIEEDEK